MSGDAPSASLPTLSAECSRLSELVLTRTFELCEVPAPPLEEGDRIALVRRWWESDGLEVTQQPIGNLWARLRKSRSPGAKAIVVAAHLDTVFGRHVKHGLRRGPDGKVTGPGCGDNGVAVAALSVLDALLPKRTTRPIWIVATVGEEGLGNLAGARAALKETPIAVGSIGAFVALEGNYLGRVNTVGVGSERRRVRLTGPGGHAWEDATAPNAVHTAAEIVHGINHLQVPGRAKTTRNTGVLFGGESVNSRAAHAEFELDLRSENAASLEELTAQVDMLLRQPLDGIEISVELIGSRPAGQIDSGHALVRAAASSLREVGVEPRLTAASTDANIAYAVGIPAVTLGIALGDGTHTETEWIDPHTIRLGLHALARTITSRMHRIANPE